MCWCVTTVNKMFQPAKSQYGQPTKSVTHTALKDSASKINIIQQKNPTSRFLASSRFTVSSIFTTSKFTASISGIIHIYNIHSGIFHIYGIHFRHHPYLRHPFLDHEDVCDEMIEMSSNVDSIYINHRGCVTHLLGV